MPSSLWQQNSFKVLPDGLKVLKASDISHMLIRPANYQAAFLLIDAEALVYVVSHLIVLGEYLPVIVTELVVPWVEDVRQIQSIETVAIACVDGQDLDY